MNEIAKVAFESERDRLRRQMGSQRELIAQRLGPPPEAERAYPRSMIMRLLTQHPILVSGIAARVAPLLLGAAMTRKLTAGLGIALGVAAATRSIINRR